MNIYKYENAVIPQAKPLQLQPLHLTHTLSYGILGKYTIGTWQPLRKNFQLVAPKFQSTGILMGIHFGLSR